MVTVADWAKVIEDLAAARKCWVLHLRDCSPAEVTCAELTKACPILAGALYCLAEGTCAVYFDDEPSALAAFGQIVGDDGPTKTNSYNGPARVYAYLAGPNGGITENT